MLNVASDGAEQSATEEGLDFELSSDRDRRIYSDVIATTIIPLPSVTKTFAMSTVLCSILYCCWQKRHRKAERYRKELARASRHFEAAAWLK